MTLYTEADGQKWRLELSQRKHMGKKETRFVCFSKEEVTTATCKTTKLKKTGRAT